MRYYIIAGEASGDLHGSNLMRGIFKHDPDGEIRFWGGEKMASVGGTMVRNYRDTAVMGVVEVIGKLGRIFKNLKFCKKDILEYNPDAVILIDYPGFNLKIAKFAHGKGFRVFYYIPPKVWARGASRIRVLKKYVTRTFIIFPFEQEYFRSKGLETVYNGNPLIDNIAENESVAEERSAFLSKHNLNSKESIALLAGSRRMEINYLLPRIVKTVEIIENKYPERFQYLLAAAPAIDRKLYEDIIGKHSRSRSRSRSHSCSRTPKIEIVENDTCGVLKHSSAAIISSGTASLEAAIIGTPQVVCYGLNPISYAIAKRIVKLDTVSLANMILGKHIFKELLQGECTPENISEEIFRIIGDTRYRNGMLSDYAAMMKCLGERNSAERNAAEIEKLTL